MASTRIEALDAANRAINPAALVSPAQPAPGDGSAPHRDDGRTSLHARVPTAPAVLVYADTPVRRAGFAQLLSPVAQPQIAMCLADLIRLVGSDPWLALVAHAGALPEVVALSQERGIPLVLIAATRDEAAAVDSEGVACVLVERDPALPTQLLRVLQALAHGERPIIVAPRMTVERRRQHLVPPRIARQFADTPLSRRELDVLWLDYQGLGMAAIAGALQIEKSTVTSHWKHIQRKLGTERAAVKAWVRARLDGGQERMVGECWRSATIETAHHWHP